MCTGRCFRHAMRNKISRSHLRANSSSDRSLPNRRSLSKPTTFSRSFSRENREKPSLHSYRIARLCQTRRSPCALTVGSDTWKTMSRGYIRGSLAGARRPVCPREWRTRGPICDVGGGGLPTKNRAIAPRESARSERGRRVVGREQWITFAPRFKVRSFARSLARSCPRLDIGPERRNPLFTLT